MSKKTLAVLMAVLIVLLACNLPSGAASSAPPSEVPPALVTAAAQTAMAALTQNAPAATLAPTLPPAVPAATLTPSPLPPPSATPTLTLTPTMTLTPTPSTPMISVSVNTNCRTGPGDAYDRVGALLVGETAEVLARDPYGLFWYIPNPDRPGGFCWVWGQYATITGDTSSLPVFTPPPTPTPALRADFVIVGVTKKICSGTAYYFVSVKNTGDTTWRSYRITAVDLLTNAAITQTGTKFPGGSLACTMLFLPGTFETLEAGQQSYLLSGIASVPGRQMRFTITLYGEEGQSGQSLTRVAEYTLP